LDGFAVARTIGLDANANKTWGIPNRKRQVTFSANAGNPANQQF